MEMAKKGRGERREVHSFQAFICLRSSAKEPSAEKRAQSLYQFKDRDVNSQKLEIASFTRCGFSCVSPVRDLTFRSKMRLYDGQTQKKETRFAQLYRRRQERMKGLFSSLVGDQRNPIVIIFYSRLLFVWGPTKSLAMNGEFVLISYV